jgi:hypothetical protein
MDEIDKNKIEQYMLNHEIKSVDQMLRMFTAAQKALMNISVEISDLDEKKLLSGGYEWEES